MKALAFWIKATGWWLFVRPFEQMQQALNEINKVSDEYDQELRGRSSPSETEPAGITQETPQEAVPARKDAGL